MSTAKTASKNNPTKRSQAKEFLYNGKKVKPTKLVLESSTFFGGEYDGSGEVVLDKNNNPLTWSQISSLN